MPSSDIYKVKESPCDAKESGQPTSQRRHRRSRGKTFDEAVDPNLAGTHLRRRGNSGARRFRHLMKRPEFSRRFWISTFSVAGAILLILLVWDLFIRYPDKEAEYSDDIYRAIVE